MVDDPSQSDPEHLTPVLEVLKPHMQKGILPVVFPMLTSLPGFAQSM